MNGANKRRPVTPDCARSETLELDSFICKISPLTYLNSFKIIRALKPDQRSFCRHCSLFVNKRIQQDEAEFKIHLAAGQNHEIIKEVTDDMLNEPIKHLLKPVEVNSFNAVSLLTLREKIKT